jgi:hypothetical protein
MPIIKTSRMVVLREVSDVYCGTPNKAPSVDATPFPDVSAADACRYHRAL